MTQNDPDSPDKGSPSPDKGAPRKDIWDKIGTLTTLISSVVIGAAGVAVTYLYNNRELDIKHIEKQAEEARLDAQTKAGAQVELTKRLEALFKFVSSENARERAFGYDVAQGIVRDEVTRYKSYLESIGFSGLQENVRLIAFAENDLEATVPSEFRSTVASVVKQGVVSFYNDGVMFVQNDWVDRPFVPLREYTHYALFQVLKRTPEQTSVESGLADYYPASFLNLVDTSTKGPARVDLSFLEDDSPRVSDSTQAGPISVVYRGRLWAASFWECRKKLSRPVVDIILFHAWTQSYQKGADRDGAVARFRDALLSLATKVGASCFREALTRRALLKS